MSEIGASIIEHFGDIQDPRVEHLNDHKLINILMIAICAVICGAEKWTHVQMFGEERREWLAQFLQLQNGIPSHDTFGRVFARINAEEFERSFAGWVQATFEATEGQVVAIDGKSVRRSHDRRIGKDAIHVVSAWAAANRLVLGQQRVDEKSNEITAIPELLRLLEVKGCIVTIDAMGCQTEIAAQIVEQGADYLLAVKQNQPHLREDIALFFQLAHQNNFGKVDHTYHRTVNKSHGRLEVRECWAISGAESLQFVRDCSDWKGLTTMVMITSQRTVNERTTTETRYYITSLANDARHILNTARTHWSIENSLHWVLDVAMGEDLSRIRKNQAPENMALLRRLALNLLKHERSLSAGIEGKRLKAAMSQDYLLKVLTV